MIKVEAVVIRERVETVIDAVEAETGHVGVTVVEAIGHGRQRGITHEYRGRIFESRFLPKAVLTFVVKDDLADEVVEAIVDSARSGNESGDGIVWTSPVEQRHTQPDRTNPGGGGDRMTTRELTIATSTVWVVVAAILVMFMQAGFAFLEAGLTRMKNVGHIAAKNVLIFALASVIYFAVGYGIAFGDGGNGLVGGSGFMPSIDELLTVGEAPFSWFGSIPAAAGYLFQVVFCAVSLAIVWGAMAERTKLWVYFVFGAAFTLVYSVVSHWIWSPDGWLFSKGMQDFAGSTVVHYQGALAGLAGALLLGPRIGKFSSDGKPNAIPGHNMAFTTLGVIILWFGWFGFNPGSTLGVDFGGVGFFAYVALNTNLAAAAGVLGAVLTSWIVIKKPDLSMMLNGAVAGLVAITAACAFVAPWAAIVIGAVAGAIVVFGVLAVERAAHRRSDRRDRRARDGGCVGHALARVPGAALAGREPRDRERGALLRRRLPPARHPAPRARRGRRVHVLRVVRDPLGDEGDVRHPLGCRVGDGGPRRVRARDVGLPRVLHPGPRRLRNRVARPCRGRPRRTPRHPGHVARGRRRAGGAAVDRNG